MLVPTITPINMSGNQKASRRRVPESPAKLYAISIASGISTICTGVMLMCPARSTHAKVLAMFTGSCLGVGPSQFAGHAGSPTAPPRAVLAFAAECHAAQICEWGACTETSYSWIHRFTMTTKFSLCILTVFSLRGNIESKLQLATQRLRRVRVPARRLEFHGHRTVSALPPHGNPYEFSR